MPSSLFFDRAVPSFARSSRRRQSLPILWRRSSTKLIRQGDVGVEVDKLRSDLAETKSSLAIDQALATKPAWKARSAALKILSPSSCVVTFMISKFLKANLPRPLVARTAALGWFTSGLDDGVTRGEGGESEVRTIEPRFSVWVRRSGVVQNGPKIHGTPEPPNP